MTISAVSSSSASFVSTFQQDRKAFGQLVGALQSGDLSSAQDAYNTLASSPLAQGNSPLAQTLQQIGQDLQSGDIAGAQKALASLQQQQHAHGHHHHHHGGSEVSGASNTNSANGTNGTNSGDPDGDGDTDGASGVGQVAASDTDNKIDITA